MLFDIVRDRKARKKIWQKIVLICLNFVLGHLKPIDMGDFFQKNIKLNLSCLYHSNFNDFSNQKRQKKQLYKTDCEKKNKNKFKF